MTDEVKCPAEGVDDMFLCPITSQVMQDPVIDPDGNSYERAAIVEWLGRENVSPITRNVLRIEDLTPNRALKGYLEAKGLIAPVARDPAAQTVAVSPPRVSLKAFYNASDGHALLRVSVEDDSPASRAAHAPATVVCVIDISGSMDSAATTADDEEGNNGLSLLDIVKHATRTIIQSLASDDRLAVVVYSNSARVILPFTNMTPENQIKAWEAVEALRTEGSTNLWDGLLQAMNLVVKNRDDQDANIILLTDGLPNVQPPRGEIHALKRYIDQHPSFSRTTISTFGFGYNLDSKLLRDIAVEGNGPYCFIPDASFVGTVFVNAMANILSTAIPKATLSLELDSCVVVENLSGLKYNKTSWGCFLQLPSLIYGHHLDILLRLTDKQNPSHVPQLRATLCSGRFREDRVSVVLTDPENPTCNMRTAIARSSVIGFIQNASEQLSKNPTEASLTKVDRGLQKLVEQYFSLPMSEFAALKADVEGQISAAYSRKDWYDKWGRHYLPSLARAHVLQRCTNFKDPGVQVYATDKFESIRDAAEDLFCQLPPPTPSVTSMSQYHNSNAPCFAKGPVRLCNGLVVDVSELRAGDSIAMPNGRLVQVKCVVRTECAKRVQELVALPGGVFVTPWHPVRQGLGADWTFPSDLVRPRPYACRYVYSFVLKGAAPAMQIGPYEAVALGHGIEDDPVATHAFLGTDKVLENLSELRGWDDGLIDLPENPGVRDPVTGLIAGFEQNTEGRPLEGPMRTTLPTFALPTAVR